MSEPWNRGNLPRLVQLRDFALPLGFIIAVGPVSVDMYLPAFLAIATEFGAIAPELTLVAYFFGFAAGQMVQGLLSDRLGRRLPLAAGLLLYTLASIGCACANDTAMFCLFRAMAAFGAAASIVVPRAIVRDLADGGQAAELMSGIMQVMSVAPVAAPVLGSILLTLAGWRMIFVAAAAYGISCLIILYKYLPETLPPDRRVPRGLLLALRRYETILREPAFLSDAMVGTCCMGALFAYLTGTPTIFMWQYHYEPWQFGVLLAMLSGGIVLCFRLNGWLVRIFGYRRIIELGIIIWLAGSGFLLLLSFLQKFSVIPVVIALLVFGLGYSFIPSNAQIGALTRHQDHAATATALMSTMQYCAGGVAGALVGKFADGTGRPMACIMVVCGLGAAIAAIARPKD